MSLFARIILWGLLLLMLKDARSQSRHVEANTTHVPGKTTGIW